MKFGQLIEYNTRNIFLEKSYTECVRKTVPRPFSKKLKLSIFLDHYSKVLYILFFNCLPSWELSKWLKLSCSPFAFTSYKASIRRLKLVSLPHFLHYFWEKYFCSYILLSMFYYYYSIVWLSLLCEILGNMCIAIVC